EKDVHYQGEKDYYGFTNFSSHKITTRGLPRLLIGDGKVDQKGNVNEELIKEVYNQPDPMEAKNFAGSKNVVREKFNQNKVLKDLLVNTGSKKLVENSGKSDD
ncbi:32237_t:CDS:2, partial [Racocetra persica]